MTIDLPEGVRLHHKTREKAEKLQSMLAAEYAAMTLVAEAMEGDIKVRGWTIAHEDGVNVIECADEIPSIAEILDACADMELNPETEAEEEAPKASGSVVPETYRALYREKSSNGQTCGDWLAETLVHLTHGTEGFHVDDFTAILETNNVDMTSAWAKLPFSGQKGWIGRYRMNGRQVLEKLVALTGTLKTPHHGDQTPPEDFLTSLRAKHEKWLTKQRKEAEAALGKVAA